MPRARRSAAVKLKQSKLDSGNINRAEEQDESEWEPRSRRGNVLSKRQSLAQYRLKDKDLKDIPFGQDTWTDTDEEPAVERPVYRYQEQDVERVAWEVHHGPDGLLKRLKRDYQWYKRSQMSKNPWKRLKFDAPSWFTIDTPSDEDRWEETEGLHTARLQLPDWLWVPINKYVDAQYLSYNAWRRGRKALRWREDLLDAAVLDLHYPTRPEDVPPESEALDALRRILELAPRYDDRRQFKAGRIIRYHCADGEVGFAWSGAYLDRLELAWHCKQHPILDTTGPGSGLAGWETIRWEVYDKFVECTQSLRTSASANGPQWVDDARMWLVGRTTHRADVPPLWRRCLSLSPPLSEEYRALLPLTDDCGCVDPHD
ncbi:hypothetical protein EXIGLDRAFT_719941 [Exidia glandulosa HHB12029]|uniref:Uncharacterized protein n=1 Tax=Exidia glandulosa HHB12029 TaxID=1314781 RepID=A0A165GPI5_EXIGL|nr:hypothetical protein EXIGLDRAFT_719941 [Exidia glandulosa HHB12029]